MFVDWWIVAVSALFVGTLMPLAIRARSIGHDKPGGVQKLHHVATSRLGGVIIVIGWLAVVGLALPIGQADLVAALPIAFAVLPVVLVGLADDLTGYVRPRYRLGAAVLSAALASLFAGGVIPRLDLPLIDPLLKHLWIVLPLTWFMVAGACNAMNLIDGSNGLAGGTALIMFGGIAAAAAWSNDSATLTEALAVMGTLVGFLYWNYPRGRVFLGDAGAYFIGFMYAQLSIRLIARNDDLSAWYVIMLAGYPIVDTLFAMYRRGVVRKTKLMAADALHLHSLLFRRVTMPIERRMKEPSFVRANARVAPRLWLHSMLCFAFAAVFHDNTPALWVGLAAYAMFYVNRYRLLIRFGRNHPRRWPTTPGTDKVKRSQIL